MATANDNDPNSNETDPYNVSIQALQPRTRNLMAALLNPTKIFLTDTGLSRDWHGLSQLMGISTESVPHLQCGTDATNKILNMWHQNNCEGATIQKLLMYLEQLDRFDVVDDVAPFLEEDIMLFARNQEVVCRSVDTPEDFILTTDDLKRVEQGLQPQKYDAFVLFADDDIAFATELIDVLENRYMLKLCVKDRDLVPGVFEHNSVIKLISERCNRLVTIFSSAFFESSSNKFFLSFGQTLGIEQGQRKIIPCVYTQCDIPPEYRIYFMLNYKRVGANFWDKLRDSIKPSASNHLQSKNIYRSASQKITPPIQYENTLKPKKEGVKFNSMVNLHSMDVAAPVVDENLNPSSSATNLTAVKMDTKKNKTKVKSFIKKILPNRGGKCTNNIIEDVPGHNKKGLFNLLGNKRKMAVAN